MTENVVKVIEGGTLIDGTGRDPEKDVAIIIEGDRIKAITKKGETQYPTHAKIIKAENKFILPGLIDMHIHYRGWDTELFLNHGITTVCDLGNYSDWILAQKDAVDRGKIARSPRIFAVGPVLNSLPAEGSGSIRPHHIGIKNPEHAREVVRQFIAKGVDGIKLYHDTTLDTCNAVAEECYSAGIPVSIHANPCDGNAADARELALAGIDCLVHASGIGLANIRDPEKRAKFRTETLPKVPSGKFPHYVWVSDPSNEPWHWMEPECFDETIRTLIEEDVYINPTLVFSWKCVHGRQQEFDMAVLKLWQNPELCYVPAYLWDIYLDYATCAQLTPQELENLRVAYRKLQDFLMRFAEAGGKILPGSDPVHSGVPGLGIHQEMQLLADVGLSPMEIIASATRYSAKFIRKDDQLGTIEAGKVADIIMTKDNPLQDIRNLRGVEVVMKAGEIMELGYHRYYENPIPRRFSSPFNEMDCQPRMNAISPPVVTEGEPSFTLTVHGGNFYRNSVVQFAGIKIPTEFVNVSQLNAKVPSSMIGKVGAYPITVFTPKRSETQPIPLLVKFK